MEMSYGTGGQGLRCRVTAARDLRLSGALFRELPPDTAAYALCRFLCRSEQLSRAYTLMSYRLRLASGRGRRPRRERFSAPAALLELGAGWIRAEVTVSPEGVTGERAHWSPEP